MNILAVDTSSMTLSVAVRTEAAFAQRTLSSVVSHHSENIMDAIIGTCKDAGIDTRDIDLFACTRGPGSFTGLRISMATLKGLALGFGKPLVSVSTLEAHAAGLPATEIPIVTALDARKQRFYLAAFDNSTGMPERILEDTDGTEADLAPVLDKTDKVIVTGPDAQQFAQWIARSYPDKKTIVVPSETRDIGRNIVELASAKFETQGPDHIGQGPVYIRKSDAEVALEAKEKANNG